MEIPNTYDISNYRKGYIFLREDSRFCKKDHHRYVKFDTKKKRHYIAGHITTYDHRAMHAIAQRFPAPNHFCILPDGFESELHIKDLKRFLFVEVPFCDVEYIIVPMDSFDPKKMVY